jgi:hypothetical protein
MTATDRSKTSRRLTRTALAACCALMLTACGGSDETPATPGPDLPPGAAEASFVSLDAIPTEVEAAIADAATRFDVPEHEVAVAGALRVTWADGSLGCPAPDTMYTQALVPGYLLTIEVAGQRVEYHGADGQEPFLCER